MIPHILLTIILTLLMYTMFTIELTIKFVSVFEGIKHYYHMVFRPYIGLIIIQLMLFTFIQFN